MIRLFTEKYFRTYFDLVLNVPIITSSALEFQFLFEILDNVSYLILISQM